MISEFMASNNDGLLDFHDDSSDWVEVQNNGLESVDLAGWYLSDDQNELGKWQFPVEHSQLNPGEHLVVFASGRGSSTPTGELHTNFRLRSGGEYLALVEPDGSTVASQISPEYPTQYEDISYGFSEMESTSLLVSLGTQAAVLVPSDDSVDSTWTSVAFDDSAWQPASTGVGFATQGADALLPGFNARMIDINGGDDGRLQTATEADAVLRGNYSESDYDIEVDLTEIVPQIDFGGREGTFPGKAPYLDGTETTRLSDIAVHVTARVTIPEGDWTIGWGSDAGGILRLSDVSFIDAINEDGTTTAGDGELIFDTTRSLQWTRGTFSVGPGGLTTDLELVYFERNGGDSLELAVASGHIAEDVDDSTWLLLADGVLDWRVETLATPPIPNYHDLISYNVEDDLFDQGTSTYLRIPFDVNDPSSIDNLELRMNYDDAFVAYLNGIEVARGNFSGDPQWDSVADTARLEGEVRIPAFFDLTDQWGLLETGVNVLAVHGMLEHPQTGGFVVLPELHATRILPEQLSYLSTATPGSANAHGMTGVVGASFSTASGSFTESLSIELSASVPDATIRYTMDGTVPDGTSLRYTGSVELTNSTQIRAKAFRPGYISLPTASEIYYRLSTETSDFTSNLPVLVMDVFTENLGEVPQTGFLSTTFALFEPADGGRTELGSDPTVAGRAGIRVRGATSASFNKKSYTFEIWRNDTDEDRRVEFLGMPDDSDWVLQAPDTMDPALIRNTFTFDTRSQIGGYAPRSRFLEMYINTGDREITESDYVGTYVLTEKIKRGNNRVDIEKLSSQYTTEPLIKGGYMIKVDVLDPGDNGFVAGDRRLNYVDPKESEILQRPEQREYLTRYIDEFGASLHSPNFTHPEFGHYSEYIDVASFIDHALIGELSWDVDSLWRSAYLFKSRDGKLESDPPWDFDRAYGSRDSRDDNPAVWYSSPHWQEEWWGRLHEDPEFNQAFLDRWQELRSGPFRLENLYATIDSISADLDESSERNFERWRTTAPRRRGGDGFKSGELDGTWRGELNHMKAWLAARVEFLDSQFVPRPLLVAQSEDNAEFVEIRGPISAFTYYTTDGTDPRVAGGAISDSASRVGTDSVYIDSVSPSTYLIPSGAASEVGWRTPDFDDTSWQSGTSELGYDTGVVDSVRTKSGFRVHHAFSNVAVLSLATADALLSGTEVKSETTVEEVPVINYLYNSIDSHFGDSLTFPNGGDSNFALQATATIIVPEGGTYTFGVNSDDGSRLRIDGEDVIKSDRIQRPRDTFATVALTAGEHTLDLVMFQRRSGAQVELFVADGSHTEFNEAFSLLGNGNDVPYTPVFQTDVQNTMLDNNASVYVRIPFDVLSQADVRRLVLEVQADDGFVAYLNGVEVASLNAPESLAFDSVAANTIRDDRAVLAKEYDISEFHSALRLGNNVLAIQGLNRSASNPDFLLAASLKVVQVPDSIRVPLDATMTLIARSYDPTFESEFVAESEMWSGVAAEQFVVDGQQPAGLRISEIHFHPTDPNAEEMAAGFVDESDFEFIEFVNTSDQEISLAEARLVRAGDNGVDFDFADAQINTMESGDRILVVGNQAAFTARYGDDFLVAGQWQGGVLSNNQEILSLSVGAAEIHTFAYQDNWHAETDGNGFSLELINPSHPDLATWGTAEAWRPSSQPGGSPGIAGDTPGEITVADIDQLFSAVNDGLDNPDFDLTGDGQVNQADVDELILNRMHIRYGDSDLNGRVDFTDFQTLASNFNAPVLSWADGDFDGDGIVTFSDFVTLTKNFG